MTKVYLEKDGQDFTVSCKGHATGSPEVCAAISCIVQALDGWLEREHFIYRRMDPGDVSLRFHGQGCDTAFELVCVGFLRLEKTAPDYVSVKFEDLSRIGGESSVKAD